VGVRATTPSSRRSDRGFTLIEVLIALTLLGGVIGGSIATLRAATIGETMHRDHSRAHAWLQSASDLLYAAEKTPCSTTDADAGELAVRTAYDAIVTAVANPPDWRDWQLRVLPNVQFWNAANLDADPDDEFFFGPACDPSLTLQLIELEVRLPDGKIIETVEIVK
jgi:prepilin-type N-terminal cleavage/methylation domain-containing protein